MKIKVKSNGYSVIEYFREFTANTRTSTCRSLVPENYLLILANKKLAGALFDRHVKWGLLRGGYQTKLKTDTTHRLTSSFTLFLVIKVGYIYKLREITDFRLSLIDVHCCCIN